MEEKEYINEIRNLILKSKHPSYETTNKKEIHVRCPYCGDSKHDASKARFYIEMKPPFRFHCFKCETSGVLSQQTLRDLGIYNNDLNLDIIEANKTLKQVGVQQIHTKRRREYTHENPYTNISVNSLNYFNNRYGISYDPEYVQEKFKAVLDPIEFMKINNIYTPPVRFDFTNAIGFISSDCSHIIFRDTSGQQQMRYFNLCCVQDTEELSLSSKIYNISGSIDALSDKTTLVMTEGIFDIIGVYSHFYKNQIDESNVIFAAACGKAYNAVIQHYIRSGFLNLDVIIYSDGDVNQRFYKDMKESNPYLKYTPIKVYYNSLYNPNTGENKDYGIPVEKIRLRQIII